MATWVVTGSNRGIGLEMCRQVKARGDTVFAACRKRSAELSALGCTVVEGVDIGAEDAGATIARALGETRIDVLMNNAGILVPDALSSLDTKGLLQQIEVNAIGPLRVTVALRGHLAKGAKIGFVSSRAGSIGDGPSGGLYGYRMSKAALNMAAKNLARELGGEGVLVAVLHPGFIRTEMTGGAGNDEPDVAAKGLIARVDELTPEKSGHFFHANGQELPW